MWTGSDERFSRATAVRYALAGAASLSLGLWRVPEGQASDFDDCLRKCYSTHDDEATQEIAACRRQVPKWVRKPPRSWERIREVLGNSPWEFLNNVTEAALEEICETRAQKRYLKSLDDCDDACGKTCRRTQSRSLQGLFRSTCRVTPPPPAKPPTIPPAPPEPPEPPEPGSEENDYCKPGGACEQVGGKCCGPPTDIPGINVCLDITQCP
jgi:hypothetical protein